MLPPEASNSHFVCCRDESPHRHLSLSLLLLPAVPPETPIFASSAVEHSFPSCLSHSQVSGSGTATFLSLVLDGMPSIPFVFHCSHILSLVVWPPRPTSGTRDRRLHTPEPQADCQMNYHRIIIPHLRVELQLPGKVRYLQTKDLVQDNQDVRKLVKEN